MRVFVYEFVTANGIGREPNENDHSLYLEGRAMRDALASDLVAVGHTVTVSGESNEPTGDELDFCKRAATCDVTFVIAPESGDWLANRTRLAIEVGGRVIGPTLEAIRLAGSKSTLAQHWYSAGVQTPRAESFGASWDTFPAVLKPNNGAGSQHTYFVNSREDVRAAQVDFLTAGILEEEMIFTQYAPGRAASVALLCGPNVRIPLAPAAQHLSTDGRFRYQGGELPLNPELSDRAVALARAATACVPGLGGYVGVDVVLGDSTDGSRDFAIEINPRLTTSYIGLRTLANFNVADAWLRVALGELIPEPQWKHGRVTFGPNGTATLAESHLT